MSFVSCEWFNSNGFEWDYKLVDTDFVEEGHDSSDGAIIGLGWGTIIKAYEKRNLDVAYNLVKAILWYSNGDKDLIRGYLDCCKQMLKYAKHKDEVEKYLMLL